MKRPTLFLPVFLLIFFSGDVPDGRSREWVAGEHPRLMVTNAEKSALITKLTTSGTVSAATWSQFVTYNQSANTSANNHHYADAGILYWVTGNATYGQRAHDAVMNYVNTGTIYTPSVANYELGFWRYRDMLLNFDFAYDRFSEAERQQVYNLIIQQGLKCHMANPAWGPGNINGLWGLCQYASAVMLDGENRTYTVTDHALSMGAANSRAAALPHNGNITNMTVRTTPGGPIMFTSPIDFTTCTSSVEGDRCLDWAPAGAEPAPGSTYYVSYTIVPRTDVWRSSGRSFLEYHLNYHWRGGSYTGGLHPYTGAATETVLDLIEIVKRDLGVDYGQNQDLKQAVDMLLYQRLPNTAGAYAGHRFDMLSDSGNWGENWIDHPSSVGGYRGWLRRLMVWGTKQYGTDPDGYGQRYLWAWGKYYRNANGTIKPYGQVLDWREALWFNDALVSSYPVTTLPTPNWPKTKFFRGRDMMYARTDQFDTTNTNAALVSLIASNHNHQSEHDQGDSGSFTFYSNQEDWAIDPGYQTDVGSGANLYDHNTVGIDGGGYNASGIYGMDWTTPRYGGFSYLKNVALNDGASTATAELTRAWSLTATPYVDHHQRYLTMVNGGPSSYLVIADDIKKDNANHSYQWYFSTGPGNTISRTGSVATVTGARNQATLDIHTVTPSTTTHAVEDWSAGNIWPQPYKRLTITASNTANPNFLHLLIPTPNGSTKPVVTNSAVTNGTKATITWSNGMTDTVLWRTATSGTITDGTITTDAKVTIVREQNNTVTGLVVQQGRTVNRGAQAILETLDGMQPVTVSAMGTVVSVTGADASRIRLLLPSPVTAQVGDGLIPLSLVRSSAVVTITAGQAFDMYGIEHGTLVDENFDDKYLPELYLHNYDKYPPLDQSAVSGALDLRSTNYDWPSRSRRDSTPWHRSGNTPSVIPPDVIGDADYSFKFRFLDDTIAGRKFRTYFRTVDVDSDDWETVQQYLRLEFDGAANQVTIAQRVNSPLVGIGNNDVVTETTSTNPVSLGGTDWQEVSVRLRGNTLTLRVNNVLVFDGQLTSVIPTAGYLQWRVIGGSRVQLDDLNVSSIDETIPLAPTSANMSVSGTNGIIQPVYGDGRSPDATTLKVYASDTDIVPSTDPDTLTVVASVAASFNIISLLNIESGVRYAVGVQDAAGNRSLLTNVTRDETAPASIQDLQAR